MQFTRRNVRGIAYSVSLLALFIPSYAATAEEEFQLNHNEEYGTLRNWGRLWVEYDQLPVPEAPLSTEDDAKLARLWKKIGVEFENVEAAWQEAFRDDPLLEQALDSYNLCQELEWQYSVLRKGLRARFGVEGYRELVKRANKSIDVDSQPWLDLQDENLVRLYLWWESMRHAAAQFGNVDDIPAGILPSEYYQWLKTTPPYSDEVSVDSEQLTKAQAAEIFRAGITHERNKAREKSKKLDEQIDLPPGMRLCLRLRNERDFHYMIGESYLQVNLPKHDQISQAEAEFVQLLEQAQAILPNILVALHRANHERLKRLVRNQEQLRATLELALRPPSNDEAKLPAEFMR